MNCARWKIDIALYAGSDLPANRLGGAIAHLEACAECRALLDDLRAGQTLLSELEDEAIEDAMAANVRRRVLARLPVVQAGTAHGYWAWALAAAVLLAAILTLPWRMEKQAPLARVENAPPKVAEAPPAVAKAQRPVARRHHRAKPQPSEPLLVQLVTDDPNIVIYWLVDPKPQGD